MGPTEPGYARFEAIAGLAGRAATLLVIVLILGACGGQSNQQHSNALHRGNGSEPDTLDPHRATESAASEILRDLYEGLTTEDPNGGIVPGAAGKWSVDNDGKRYRFELRNDLRWSNGDALTADDFVGSFRRSVNPATANPNVALLSLIENAEEVSNGTMPLETLGVVAIDDSTLEFRLDYPAPYFLRLLSHSVSYPVHQKQRQNTNGFTKPGELIGNGAYVLDDWTLHDRMRLKKNPYYRDADAVSIDTVYFYPVDDENAEFNLFRSGQLDITDQIPNSRFQELNAIEDGPVQSAPYLSTYFYVFDLSQPPLDDPLVRKALSMAINRNDLVQAVTGAGEVPAFSLVPPGVPGYEPSTYGWRNMPDSERLAQAKVLYAQAGYSAEKPLQLGLRFNSSENQRQIAVAIASMWREALGIETELHGEEWRVFLSRRDDPEQWDIFRFGWVGDYADANNFLEIFTSNNAQNFGGYANSEFDGIIASAAVASGEDRQQMLAAAESELLASYAIAPLFFYVSKHLVSDRVSGFRPNVLDHTYSRHLSIDAGDL